MPASVVEWRRGVEAIVHDLAPASADEVLDSISFIRSLDPAVNFNPGTPELTAAVEAALGEWLQERATEAGDPSKPYGNVQYADPGYQADGKHRYPLDTEAHVRAAWSYINQSGNAAKYSSGNLAKVKARIKAAARKLGIDIAEDAKEAIDGRRSAQDLRVLLDEAVRDRCQAQNRYGWSSVEDFTDDQVVYRTSQDMDGNRKSVIYQCSYTLTGSGTVGTVELGEPTEVVAQTWYVPAADKGDAPTDAMGAMGAGESKRVPVGDRDRVEGRVVEAKGTDDAGGRVFRVRLIAYGTSRNGRRYPEQLMRESAALYEGARAYDHHRTLEELRSGSMAGLIGWYRGVEAGDDGLYGNLHLLPSATHAAEALDASLAAQTEGLPPLVGISHDVRAHFTPAVESGRRVQEATAIVEVQSTDVVATPAAGGRAVRAVAGGTGDDTEDQAGDGSADRTEENEETDVPVTTDDVLAALSTATPEQLAAHGLTRAGTATTESTQPTGAPVRATENKQTGTRATEAGPGEPKDSFIGKLMIRAKVEQAGFPAHALNSAVESVTAALPDRVTESDVDAGIASLKSLIAPFERAGLTPAVGSVQVVQEAREKKVKALDDLFAHNGKGYVSFRQAFLDFTGYRPRDWGEDVSRTILRECFGYGFDSGARASESLDTTSWAQVLGDSVTRRMVAEYQQPNLQTWRRIVSSTPGVNDFRTQRVARIGGYGTLPTVAEGAPYQLLTSPPDEEATYALTKKGGLEELTLEMIANDDVRAISNIPRRLGLAAAQTLYRFVFDLLATNVTCTYDSTALFHANHSNTTAVALSQSGISTLRTAMRQQAAYGDSSDILSLVPRTLVVPSALEEIAFQLTRSAVAIPSTPAGPSDTPNIHQNMDFVVVDYFADANDWFVSADPSMAPTIEIGFYLGRQDPELFTQSDQTSGAMFQADTYTYKIRHIYSGTPLDHRAFQRGTQ